AFAGALAQRRFQVGRAAMLLEQIAERLVRELLKIHHAIARQQIDGLPSGVIELNPLARHQRPLGRRSPRSPSPCLATIFALRRRSWASDLPTSSLSLNRPRGPGR